jgi:hypothetical protein
LANGGEWLANHWQMLGRQRQIVGKSVAVTHADASTHARTWTHTHTHSTATTRESSWLLWSSSIFNICLASLRTCSAL